MKQALEILYFYCKAVNEQMIGILENLPEAKLREDMRTYFKSLWDSLNHMTRVDANWLIRLKDNFSTSSLSKNELLQIPAGELQARMEGNQRELFAIRKTADILLAEFIRELPEEDLERVIAFKSKHGDDMAAKLGNILLQLFIHQTHHRGAISAMLDIQGVDNDYSTLLKYLPAQSAPPS